MLPRVPSVLALVPGGGAADAGILEDDALEALNGVPLDEIGPDLGDAQPSPLYDRLGRQIEAIDAALAAGLSEFSVRRADTIHLVTIIPEQGCDYEAQVVLSSDLNGGADGHRIAITSALVDYTASDDELAILLGHELAHNILAHATRPRTRGLSGLFGRNGRSPSVVREGEVTADRMGLFLAARAGYDVSRAPAFRRRFSHDYAAARYGFWGYPSGEDRALAHEVTVREIDALRARGETLTP